MRRSILVVSGAAVVVFVTAWVALNPAGRFGLSRDMLTTYNRAPVPFADLEVRSDGAMRLVGKTHQVGAEQLAWLARPKPDVLIIATGWQGEVRAAGRPADLARTTFLTLPTGQALATFNALRARMVQVAIHVHSTC